MAAFRKKGWCFMIHIVLLQPEIPQNTGNIARTCSATGAALHLVEPLGFSIDDKHLKRAGLDYWDKLQVYRYPSTEEFFRQNAGGNFYFFTTKAEKNHCQVNYEEDVYLIFGRETRGIDEEILVQHRDHCVRIPMRTDIRSLNLSNSAAIAIYEVLRQRDFAGLESEGHLHRLHWEH